MADVLVNVLLAFESRMASAEFAVWRSHKCLLSDVRRFPFDIP